MKILFVAAEPRELASLARRCKQKVPVACGVEWALRGKLGEHDVFLVANGAGRDHANMAVEWGCVAFPAELVVNTGFCGAVHPQLTIGQVVEATAIGYEDLMLTVRTSLKAKVTPATGMVLTIDKVAQTAREKAGYLQAGAIAVEMEAAGAAEAARVKGLPFVCIRAVTDLANETFANDFNGSLRSDGHFDTMRILRGTFRDPMVCWRELFRLQRRCALAARSLGDFFADCRF
jgi:adenosylhomocysteine nucleosidase